MTPAVSRREFVKVSGGAALMGAGLVGGQVSAAAAATATRAHAGSRPNVVFIMVDELRFPRTFPDGIETTRQFLRRFMPNVAGLWERGVKFANHYSAATSCGPARAALVTGLYPHQTWNLITPPGDVTPGASLAPALQTAFPTYGKLMRRAGYRTPYVGKWHLSGSPADPAAPGASTYLEDYGFDGRTIPDVTGLPGQGLADDPVMAGQAVEWLSRQRPGRRPFCLTVSLVNPHDKQFFWGGTEAARFEQVYADNRAEPVIPFTAYPGESDPPEHGYPDLAPNWESAATLAANKPACQTFNRSFSALLYGDASEDPGQTGFGVKPYLGSDTYKIAVAPFSYWRRSLDSYTQVMELVDKEIGRVIRAIPRSIRSNTVIVLTSDHGEYAGAHGMLSGKEGTMYEECMKVPLIVVDPRGVLTGDVDHVRHGITSSVDVLPMLATIAHGDRGWIRGAYADAYRERLDLLPVLKRASGRTRTRAWMASDEFHGRTLDFIGVPRHVLGVRTKELKVASYSYWNPRGVRRRSGMEVESYDFSTKRGRWELDNFRCDSGAARTLLKQMNREAQMRAPLPTRWRAASNRARAEYLRFIKTIS